LTGPLTVEEPGQTQMELVDLVKPCNDAAVDHVGKWSLGATHWKQCGRRRQAQTDICFFFDRQIPTPNLETRHVELRMLVRSIKCKLMTKLISKHSIKSRDESHVHNYVKIRQHRATENNFNDGLFALNRFIL
jgi:hypothetical protein